MPESIVSEQVASPSPEPVNPLEAPVELSDLLVEDVSIDGMCGVY